MTSVEDRGNVARIMFHVESSTDFFELNQRMLSDGLVEKLFVLRAEKERFVDMIKTVYINNIHDGVSDDFNQHSSILPGTIVQTDGVTYHIHGTIHDAPGLYINYRLKHAYAQRLSGLHVVCEDGYTEWIPYAKSFQEAEGLGLKNSLVGSVLDVSKYALNFLNLGQRNLRKKLTQVNSVEDLDIFRKSLFRIYLPEPLGMNSLMYIKDAGTITNPTANVPAFIKRIFHEAKTAIQYSIENSVGELHIVVGCAHEKPLEYLLQHQTAIERWKHLETEGYLRGRVD